MGTKHMRAGKINQLTTDASVYSEHYTTHQTTHTLPTLSLSLRHTQHTYRREMGQRLPQMGQWRQGEYQ